MGSEKEGNIGGVRGCMEEMAISEGRQGDVVGEETESVLEERRVREGDFGNNQRLFSRLILDGWKRG